MDETPRGVMGPQLAERGSPSAQPTPAQVERLLMFVAAKQQWEAYKEGNRPRNDRDVVMRGIGTLIPGLSFSLTNHFDIGRLDYHFLDLGPAIAGNEMRWGLVAIQSPDRIPNPRRIDALIPSVLLAGPTSREIYAPPLDIKEVPDVYQPPRFFQLWMYGPNSPTPMGRTQVSMYPAYRNVLQLDNDTDFLHGVEELIKMIPGGGTAALLDDLMKHASREKVDAVWYLEVSLVVLTSAGLDALSIAAPVGEVGAGIRGVGGAAKGASTAAKVGSAAVKSEINPALLARLEAYKAWKVQAGIKNCADQGSVPGVLETQLFWGSVGKVRTAPCRKPV